LHVVPDDESFTDEEVAAQLWAYTGLSPLVGR
jgi:hypothetical protein